MAGTGQSSKNEAVNKEAGSQLAGMGGGGASGREEARERERNNAWGALYRSCGACAYQLLSYPRGGRKVRKSARAHDDGRLRRSRKGGGGGRGGGCRDAPRSDRGGQHSEGEDEKEARAGHPGVHGHPAYRP